MSNLNVEESRQQTVELRALRQALETERRRYREVFELAPDCHVLTDLDGVIREANRATAALLSVRPDFLVNKSILLFIDENEQPELTAAITVWRSASRVEGDRPSLVRRGLTRLRVYKGASFPADYTISPARDGRNQIIGLRWILRDLSESTRAAEALREREYHYVTLLDNAGDSIAIHNLTGRFLEVNRVACETLGYAREELLRLTPADIEAPGQAERIPARWERLRSEGRIFYETLYMRRDGTTFPVEINSRLIDYTGDQAVLSIARDITERKRGEAALMRLAAQLTLLNQVGRQIAAILGLDRVFADAARLVQENFGYHHVALFRFDDEQHELVMEAIAGNFVNLFPARHRIRLGQGMVGWVGQHGIRLLAADVYDEPHYINFYPDLIPTRSELSVPMRVGERTLGVIDVQSPELNAFDDDDVMVIETLADQIAIAIANARLYEAAQQARRAAA
jgi:PAS domain S-box-containing protein